MIIVCRNGEIYMVTGREYNDRFIALNREDDRSFGMGHLNSDLTNNGAKGSILDVMYVYRPTICTLDDLKKVESIIVRHTPLFRRQELDKLKIRELENELAELEDVLEDAATRAEDVRNELKKLR